MPNLNTFSPNNPPKLDEGTQANFAKGSHIVVIGAGAFGSWSSLYLLRKGFRVTLLDAWGPAHARSSSSDATRVIRSTYGANETYFDLNVEAIALWKENQERFGKQIFFNTGVLWFCYQQHTPLVDDSIPFAQRHKMEYEYLTADELKKRFSQINVTDLHHAYFDPYGGYLKAKESVEFVHQAFLNEGGRYIQSHVQPGRVLSNRLDKISLSDGSSLQADGYLFACGSWLGKLFPEILGNVITCTKQAVYYFEVPSAYAPAFQNLPVWVDVDGIDFYYGISRNEPRSFKIGVDIRGEIFDPTSGDRNLSPETLKKASAFMAHRFPNLKNAALIAGSACPYENSPDGNFIFDRLPETSNAFILGGGSGHGFKHGPALGHLVSQVFAGEKRSPALFSLAPKLN